MQDLVAIAKIVKSRGLRGETVALILTDFPDRFSETQKVIAVLPGGGQCDLIIENFRFQKDRILLKFKGIETIEEAEILRDAEICVTESEAVELDKDEYFDWQLEGCLVETLEGKKIGRVTELMRTGGTEVLVVQGPDKEYLIPFAEAICPTVDIAGQVIKVDVPEGLLEF